MVSEAITDKQAKIKYLDEKFWRDFKILIILCITAIFYFKIIYPLWTGG